MQENVCELITSGICKRFVQIKFLQQGHIPYSEFDLQIETDIPIIIYKIDEEAFGNILIKINGGSKINGFK